jgi:tagaturonate reductase
LLYHRFKFFSGAPGKALTLIPCELIDRNGQKLRDAIIQYIRLWDLPDAFLNWIQHHTSFCNTLVDRIVPGFPKETITQIQDAIGFEDNLVVVAEPFHLWVIEGPDQVGQLMPAADASLDVLFVKDQTPYRTRKVRILNGAHTSLVPVAYLHGLRTVREAVEDPFAGTFLKEAIEQEIIPTLDLPEKELRQFAHSVLERFRNPFIKHELSAIALNSISKYKVRVLPSILEYVSRKGKLPERLLYSLACLIRFYKGEWRGEALPVNDDPAILQRFEEAWQSGDVAYVASGILSDTELWDTDLTHIPGVTERVSAHLEMLQSEDIETAWAGKP